MPPHPRAATTALALGLLAAAVPPAQASTPTPSPSSSGVSASPEGAGRLDVAALQAIVDEAAADDVRLSVGVRSLDGATLTDGAVVVGSTEEYSSASLIKVALVTTVLRAVDRGELALDQTVTVTGADDVPGTGVLAGYSSPYEATVAELCELAITVSDNTASNVLAEEVGLDQVDQLVEDLGVEPTHMGRLFFSDGPADESNDLDTASTVELYRAVYEGDVLSPASRDLLLGWMREQQLDTKFAPALPDVPLASKTGDTSSVSHDGAYLLGAGRETVLVVLSETDDGRSPTQAADPYLADVAEEVGAQVAGAHAHAHGVGAGDAAGRGRRGRRRPRDARGGRRRRPGLDAAGARRRRPRRRRPARPRRRRPARPRAAASTSARRPTLRRRRRR
ncbi:serine hydrolase [Pseudokineococcus basanitobsidens]|uniref:Serine hydrolase n=1 Tax=Pseudokineococcus basanitobsidens TaxID=1926649 RepID=A0ABU8RKH1_9ACTN